MKHRSFSSPSPWLALLALAACSPENQAAGDSAPTAQPSSVGPASAPGAAAGASAPAMTHTAAQSTAGKSGSATAASGATESNAGDQSTTEEGAQAGGAESGTTTTTNNNNAAPAADAESTPAVKLTPTMRNPKYQSLAPAVGAPLPRENMGMWNYTDIEGAVSRDGSPAGFYYKYSKTGNKNLLVYLVGGGVCPDNSFCNINPANRNESLTAEGIGAGAGNALLAAPDPEPQDPNLERWQSGIFKDDPSNPVKDWNMVFIPYVTGDVYFGSRPDATIPDVSGTFQFVGKTNMQKFFERIVPTFADAEIALMAGSSAGGIGTLLNATYFADGFIDQGNGVRVFILDDAGPFFEDDYLEVCIQQRYREIFGLNESFPADCEGCVTADGGGLAAGILRYLVDKYPGEALGGLIDSSEDEIMKFFFSEGRDNCAYIDNPIGGLLAYPDGLYPKALASLLQLVPDNTMSSYIWEGTLHQNVFMTASGDRFYQNNGLEKTPAQWLAGLLAGKYERIGVVK